MMLRRYPFALLTLCLMQAVSGCVPAIIAGTAVGVSAARQERSIGNAIDDKGIQAALNARLINASTGLFLRVSTNTVEGRVVLAGRVSSPDARIDATRIAWSVEGVRKVDNDIEVTETGGWLDGPSDLIMRTQLAARLLGDKTIKDVNYTVDVVHGVIYVMGVAQDQEELDRVLAHADTIRGKRRVENYAVLKTDPVRYGFGAPIAQR